jgi:hypothetical protein
MVILSGRNNWIAAVGAIAVLAGCSRGSGVGAPNSDATSPGGPSKLDAYTSAYNILVGANSGLQGDFDEYERAQITGPEPMPGNVHLIEGWLNTGRDKLAAARAMPGGGEADLDSAADHLLPPLNTLLAHRSGLNTYYESGAWRDDKLARGKREDVVLVSQYKAVLAAMTRFDAAMSHARDARQLAELDQLKRSGDMVGYQSELALRQARDLLHCFQSNEDLQNPAALKLADTRAAELQKTLEAQHAVVSKAQSSGVSDPQARGRLSTWGITGDNLARVLAAYRELRAGGGLKSYDEMVEQYNETVQAVNFSI